MHSIEYDGSTPAAPWHVTTDDGGDWHSKTEIEAVAELMTFVTLREKERQLTEYRLRRQPHAPEPPAQLPDGVTFA